MNNFSICCCKLLCFECNDFASYAGRWLFLTALRMSWNSIIRMVSYHGKNEKSDIKKKVKTKNVLFNTDALS